MEVRAIGVTEKGVRTAREPTALRGDPPRVTFGTYTPTKDAPITTRRWKHSCRTPCVRVFMHKTIVDSDGYGCEACEATPQHMTIDVQIANMFYEAEGDMKDDPQKSMEYFEKVRLGET